MINIEDQYKIKIQYLEWGRRYDQLPEEGRQLLNRECDRLRRQASDWERVLEHIFLGQFARFRRTGLTYFPDWVNPQFPDPNPTQVRIGGAIGILGCSSLPALAFLI